MTTPKLIASCLMALIAGCGAATKRDESSGPTKTGGGSGAGSVAFDSGLTGDEASSQIDDAVQTANEDVDQEGVASAALVDTASVHDAKRYRNCVASGNTAVVSISKSIDDERSVDGKFRTGSSTYKLSYDKQRTWSRKDGQVQCATDMKHADLPTANMKGVALDVTFTNNASAAFSLTNVKKGTLIERSVTRTATGTRHAVWTDVKVAAGVMTIAKEVTFKSTRTLDAKAADGTATSLARDVVVDADPLKVEVQRDASTLDLQKRIIHSGTVTATGADGSRHVTKFTDLTYDYTVADKCAVSGTIHGEIYDAKDATTAAKTYDIDLDQQEITFSDGSTATIALPDCSDDNEESVTDESSKDAVKA